jgi:hypothetical protein
MELGLPMQRGVIENSAFPSANTQNPKSTTRVSEYVANYKLG